MMRSAPALAATAALAMLCASDASAEGDAVRGARAFQACLPCHSTMPDVQMTGPSLAKIWGREAGTVAGFSRYSDALKRAKIVWNAATLDKWLADPDAFVPGTAMTFPGLRDRDARQDVIAYLYAVSTGNAPAAAQQGGGMMGMRSAKEDLKKAPPEAKVASLAHCKDTYTVKTADGKVHKVWEYNLRLKTDSSALGPRPGEPVIIGAGMQGDRASVVFASPDEIGRSIREACP
jgi:cytochrome c